MVWLSVANPDSSPVWLKQGMTPAIVGTDELVKVLLVLLEGEPEMVPVKEYL